MALSTNEQKELDELVEKRQVKLKAKDRAEREAELAALELTAFLRSRGLTKAKATNGLTAMLSQFTDWQHIDAELVEKDFPRDQYPQLYVPRYSILKELANERVHAKDPGNTAAVSKYTGHVERLVLRAPQKNRRRSTR